MSEYRTRGASLDGRRGDLPDDGHRRLDAPLGGGLGRDDRGARGPRHDPAPGGRVARRLGHQDDRRRAARPLRRSGPGGRGRTRRPAGVDRARVAGRRRRCAPGWPSTAAAPRPATATTSGLPSTASRGCWPSATAARCCSPASRPRSSATICPRTPRSSTGATSDCAIWTSRCASTSSPDPAWRATSRRCGPSVRVARTCPSS